MKTKEATSKVRAEFLKLVECMADADLGATRGEFSEGDLRALNCQVQELLKEVRSGLEAFRKERVQE